jgi:HPt (histidine-containing phosphotransfer) domain-containing protein
MPVVAALKLSSGVEHILSGCAPLNAKFLNEQTFQDRVLRTEILHLFLAQLDGFQKSLALPLSASGWFHLVHTLKGAAAAVGAEEIATLAQHWESAQAPKQQVEQQAIFEAVVRRFKSEIENLA